jgi:hypothetical protein
MKHIAALFIALISLTFFIGADCDSGDFQTSYFFCCDQTDPTGTNCTSDPTQCPADGCSTGQQVFTNGQNECTTLQLDASNNNCGLLERVNWYIAIGCSGGFAENPQMEPPSNVAAAPNGVATIVLSWTPAPTTLAGVAGALTFNVNRGTCSGCEGLLFNNVVGNTFSDTALGGVVSGTTYYYTVNAVNIAGTSGTSLEVFATAQ